ncbi:AMIN domain-containing protein [Ferrimonas lipolytica]|uniref:N-acetylmuramoyl-L-alanine amidase n=2 Tax=Ferrimonas lipolytica TaxID=2724191 RepID=A0A6H1UIJ7_9GAMM|nr:N-acetylmuramoyl-L-alanine amidase [Ferrimonas lipolytica]QIZ78648.1 AMIN domain-containing protein [Ferrimonas lipolytica]
MNRLLRTLSLILLGLFTVSAWANQVNSARLSATAEKTRLVFELSQKPNFTTSRLSSPDRIVIDIKNTTLKTKLEGLAKQTKLIERIRTSQPAGKGQLRVVLDMAYPSSYKAFKLGPSGKVGHRLVVDVSPSSSKAAKAQVVKPGRDIVIAIDAGHGGKDPGSIGPSGIYEKNIVLPIAKQLKAKIDATKGFRAVLIRSGDYFVSLNQRSEQARQADADLLVSIHADAFSSPQPRGASVWVLSLGRANNEMGRWLEKDDKLSELRGIGEVISESSQGDEDLQRTIVDLARQNNMAESHTLAGHILSEFNGFTKLHKKQPQAASLAVLKSPDLVSLLVEVGFISNPKEEKMLRSSAHQNRLANALQKTITNYFKSNPPRDSWLAQTRTHKVSSGESLSVIARRYGVTLTALKQANHLKNNTIRIGQNLVIPRV